MTTLANVKANDKNCIRFRNYAADCTVTTGYCKFKRFCDIVKIPIGYAHAPYKVVNIGNLFLVGIFFKYNATAPRYDIFLNPFILK